MPVLKPRRLALALLAILSVAVAVRFWRVGWGLADRMAFADELLVWPRYLFAFIPFRLASFVPRDFVYPTFFGYLGGGATALANLLGLVPQGPDRIFTGVLIARSISALAGVVTVGVVGAFGWRFYSPRAGIFAAALMAVVPFEVMQSHYANVDIVLGLFATATLFLSAALAQRGTVGLAVAAGAAVAVAFSTKYNGATFLIAPAWAALDVAFRERSARRAVVLGGAVGVGFLLGVLLACPPCVISSLAMLDKMAFYQELMHSPWLPPNNHIAPALGWYARPIVYQLVASLPYAFGWPLYAAVAVGVVTALRRRTAPDRVVLVTVGAYLLVTGQTNVAFVRYLLPTFGGLVVLAGRGLAELRVPTTAKNLATGAIFLYSLALTLSQVARFSYDQQLEVARFLRQNLRVETASAQPRVGIPQGMDPWYGLSTPLASVGLTPIRIPEGQWLTSDLDALIVPDWLAVSIRRDRPDSSEARELALLESGGSPYEKAGEWRSRFLQQDLYAGLDPAFAYNLFQGEIGFTVYLRKRAAID